MTEAKMAVLAEQVLEYAAGLVAKEENWLSGDFDPGQYVDMEYNAKLLVALISKYARMNCLDGVVDA
jgi:hypothetical protein